MATIPTNLDARVHGLSVEQAQLASYPVGVPANLNYPNIPARGILDRAARECTQRVAAEFLGYKFTYGQIDSAALNLASWLQRRGVCTGQRVGVLLPNCPEYLIALNAIWRAGGVAVAISNNSSRATPTGTIGRRSGMNRLERLAIVAGARTPQAKAFGALANVSAVDLGKHALLSVLERAQLAAEDIDEVVFGNVSGPPDAANVARVISLAAGVPYQRIAHTVNRNCASGMEAIVAGWQAIAEGRAAWIIAGGTESMSKVPWLTAESFKAKLMAASRAKSMWSRSMAFARFRPRDFKPVIGIQLGLTDPSCGLNMGQTAELLAQEFAIDRKAQDQFAVESHRKAVEAAAGCFLSGEIAPIKVADQELSADVGPRAGQSMDQLSKLKPIFERGGTVTAGNSCPLTDGASAILLASQQAVSERGQAPLGYVTAYDIAGCDPRRMGLGPVFATAKMLKQTGLNLSDFDLIEINEAFAAQVIACTTAMESSRFAQEHLGRTQALGTVDPAKLNVHGGAIALGHPVGSTGTRLVLTLLRALRERGLQRGLATLCVGGGQGFAMMVEVN